ncbi:hypothetical protein RHS01_00636 [Rhizoctonia solani]|uniref:Phosphatidate phosphatase APP1 catalytic domain-containing protein n=1 Tax=Rhizoctonia solani TaxID=456999 RepID=A0A8H7M6C9_9AGAM|nr:hypothetical protein RHS01_00636 [Rhizoctonia solani]
MARSLFVLCVGTALCSRVIAHPPPEPRATPTPTTPVRRDLTDIPASVTSLLGSAIPSDAAGGILPAWLTMPSDDQIKEQLGLNDTSISQLPVEVMNIPGYANWTANGWNNRIHGYVYKNPPATADQLDAAAQVFVPSLDESGFTDANRAMARNVTAALITLPVQNYSLQFNLRYNGQPAANITFPLPTDDRGEYDQFVPFTSPGLVPNGGNASSYLVPPQGITLVADIDDILRVTRIYQPADGLRNSFALPYVPWMNMPDVLKSWEQRVQGLHFHYLTTTPIKVTQFYESFIYANYPLGSFDIRPLNLTTVDQIFQVRKVNLHRIFETFPQRKFVLLADTSNGDIMKQYPAMYDTSGFKDIDNSTYMFFRTPDDIAGLDFSNGDLQECVGPSNVTFEYQGLPSVLGNAAVFTRPNNLILAPLLIPSLLHYLHERAQYEYFTRTLSIHTHVVGNEHWNM